MKNYLQKFISTLMETKSQGEDFCSARGEGKLHGTCFASTSFLPLAASGSYVEKGALFLGISLVLLIILIAFRLKLREE